MRRGTGPAPRRLICVAADKPARRFEYVGSADIFRPASRLRALRGSCRINIQIDLLMLAYEPKVGNWIAMIEIRTIQDAAFS